MTTNRETGHAKMVSNFRTLINNIKILDNRYNPSNTSIQVAQLESLLADAETQIENLTIANANYKQKVVNKSSIFKDLSKLTTRIVNVLQSSGVNAKTIENAKFFNRKIQGRRSNNKPTEAKDPNTLPIKTISTSQKSASQQIQHLTGLISLLELEPNYKPNEVELQIPTLQTFKNDLLTSLDDIDIAYSNVSLKRTERNKVLYSNNPSIYQSATEAKNYIKAIFGLKSLEYKKISKLVFSRPKG